MVSSRMDAAVQSRRWIVFTSVLFIVLASGQRSIVVGAAAPLGSIAFTGGQPTGDQASTSTVVQSLVTAYRYVSRFVSNTFDSTAAVAANANAATLLAAVATESTTNYAIIDDLQQATLAAAETAAGSHLVAVPLHVVPLMCVYSLPSAQFPLNTSNINTYLRLDAATLAAIFAGQITRWNHTAIVALNQRFAYLSLLQALDQPIRVIVRSDSSATTQAFTRYLSTNASAPFATQVGTSRLPNWGGVPSANVSSEASMRTTVAATDYAIGYLTYYEYLTSAASLPYVHMINQAGSTVTLTQTNVLALTTASNALFDTSSSRHLVANPIDTGATNAIWPLAHYSYFVSSASVNTTDCSASREMLRWAVWSLTNSQAGTMVWSSGYAVPHFSVIKRQMDKLGFVTCNGDRALPTRYIVSSGASLPNLAFQWWINLYERQGPADVLMTYVPEGSTAGKNNIKGSGYGPNTDLGASDAAEDYTGMGSDLHLLPALAAAVVFVYNVPEIVGLPPLLLSRSVCVGIYLGQIFSWRDPAILALNPEHAALLPNANITVVARSDGSGTTSIFTSGLSRFSAQFNASVGPSELVNWGNASNVASTPRNFIVPSSRFVAASGNGGVVSAVSSRTYSMGYSAGRNVSASGASIRSALAEFATSFSSRFTVDATDGSDNSSYPLTGYSYFIVHTNTSGDCAKSQALLDYILWTQTESAPIDAADQLGYSVTPIGVRRQFILTLSNISCGGVSIFSYIPCLLDGVVCSDHGTCLNGGCICEDGFSGTICGTRLVNGTSSDDNTVAIAVGVAVPLGVLLLCCLLALWLVTMWLLRRQQRRQSGNTDWIIAYSELEMGDIIAVGGYGEVRKAEWKGSQVAVKVLANQAVSKQIQDSFAEEVQLMMNLRHPNVVLFMGAVVKPPNLCIVMEYMEIGSLYDVIHNQLLPDDVFTIPRRLRLAAEASKGIQFLHMTGIVHRDLKSLNLLLDANWNVKIADFGLTKVKGKLGRKKTDGLEDDIAAMGSVHWMAPEQMEDPDAVSKASDIYSFGIILWETITRQDPYAGMSPAAISVKVMRDQMRPEIPDTCPDDLAMLIANCWAQDPSNRPECVEVTSRLQSMYRSGSSTHSHSSGFSSASYFAAPDGGGHRHGSSRGSMDSRGDVALQVMNSAPRGLIAIVFTDVQRAAALWEFSPAAMRDATLLHNDCIRRSMANYGGHEVTLNKEGAVGGEGSFCIAFQHLLDAVRWATLLQEQLMKEDWPPSLLAHADAAEEWDAQDVPIFRGLRVRVGIHWAEPRAVQDPITKRVEYIGPHVSIAAHVTTLAKGGQILLSPEAYAEVKSKQELQDIGQFMMAGKFDLGQTISKLYEYRPSSLITRFVGETESSLRSLEQSGVMDENISRSVEMRPLNEEVTFLTSANLCRWIINFKQINLGKQIGMGSFGLVYKAKWKGVDVAVKKFIKQKLTEKRMLEIRAEAAFLSELHHPHIVMFIGACVKQPNLCIVTEYMQRGNLRDVLRDKTIPLPWNMRMSMAKSIGLALRYMHTLEPVIIHRDLKSSNILVDENWNVKVGDFGFARLRDENATMTRCGTPSWTAPEVIRGEEYNEKADIYSFGVVLWELLTRAVPYGDQSFLHVVTEVLKGVRPKIPPKTDPQLEQLITECWDNDPKKRPKLTKLLRFFAAALNEPAENEV